MVNEYNLEKFRKTRSTRAYRAFGVSDESPIRLKIMPIWRAKEYMHYAYLQRVLENGYGGEIGLVFTFADVIIKGSNLEVVVEAIATNKCTFIQEFDKDVWEKPEDASSPFIESIEIYAETRDLRPKARDQTSNSKTTE